MNKLNKIYCEKCEFWLYDKADNERMLLMKEIHQKYGCEIFKKQLAIVKESLIAVYGENWEKEWKSKIPSYLKNDNS